MHAIELNRLRRVAVIIIMLLSMMFASSKAIADTIPTTDAPTASTPTTGNPATLLKIHTYITHLYDLDPATSSFKAIIWLTATYPSEMDNLLDQIEFIDANSQSRILAYSKANPDGSYSEFAKYYVTLSHHFDLSRYPFDTQIINIHIEDARSDVNKIQLQFISPKLAVDGIIDPDALPKGWKLNRAQPKVSVHTYKTNFGDLNRPEASSYSRLTLKFLIERHNTRLFFSLFSMLYIAYLLSLFALLMPPNVSFFPTTSGLLAASVFSLVGNFIISNKLLLHTLSFTLIDKIQVVTLALMLLTYLTLIYNGYLAKSNQIKRANRVRTISIWGSITLYIISNIIILF